MNDSDGAKKYAENLHSSNIVLIDGNALMGLMIKNNLGVSVEQVYEVKRIRGTKLPTASFHISEVCSS